MTQFEGDQTIHIYGNVLKDFPLIMHCLGW